MTEIDALFQDRIIIFFSLIFTNVTQQPVNIYLMGLALGLSGRLLGSGIVKKGGIIK